MGSVGANKGTVNNGNQTSLDRALGIQNNNMTSLDREREARARAVADQEKLLRRIDKAAFKSQGAGLGQWTVELEGIGGASILDETQTRAGGYGRYKTYSVQTWGADFKDIGTTQYATTLNQAKELARRKLRGTVM